MRGRLLISDSTTDFSIVRRLYGSSPGNENQEEISETTLKKLATNHGTKVIIVNGNNKDKLQLIKNSLNELKTWHYDANKDFVYYKFLDDKTWLIILNNINSTTEGKLENLIIKQTN